MAENAWSDDELRQFRMLFANLIPDKNDQSAFIIDPPRLFDRLDHTKMAFKDWADSS